MNKEDFSLINKITSIKNLPLETLITIKKLYEDNNLPENIRQSIEKLCQLISQAKYKSQQPFATNEFEEQHKYASTTFIYPEEKMANGMPIYTAYKAMLEKDTWIEETISKLALYRYEGKSNADNYIEHYINKANTKEIITLPFTEAIQIIDKYGIDTAKLHLILAVHACRQDEPWKAMFTLKGTDLIQALGWHRNKHLTKTEKLKKISQLAWVTNCLLIQAKWIYGRSKKDKDKYQIAIETSRVWDLSVRQIGKENPLTRKVDNPEEVEITIRPGLGYLNLL